MLRFTIYKVEPDTEPVANEPGKRITIALPDALHNFRAWHDLLNKILDDTDVSRSIRATIIDVAATFSSLPKPQ